MTDNKELLILDSESFDREVLQSDVPVIVDFHADWCGPCRAIAPTIETLATETSGEAKVAKVDADANPELLERYGVQSIPTLVFFQGGKEVDRIVGLAPLSALAAKLRKLAAEAAA